MKIFTQVPVLILLIFSVSWSQSSNFISKPPKIVFFALVSYNYSFNDNSDVLNFSAFKDTLTNQNAFNAGNYAMQQGLGILTQGKIAVTKNRKILLTGTLGYNYFYNTGDDGYNR